MQIDAAQAARFLQLLGKTEANARLRAFPHKQNPNRAAIGARKGHFDLQLAQQWQDEGRGIYVVINGGGDTKAAIHECIAYFAEFDGIPEPNQLTAVNKSGLPTPSLITRTSGGSLHFYWLLDEPLTNSDQWQQDMKRIAAYLGSDPAVTDPSRVMRLPGCAYIGPDGSPTGRVEILSAEGHRYRATEVTCCLPAIAPPPAPKPRRYPIAPRHTLGELADALACIPPRPPYNPHLRSHTYPLYRDILWGLIAACQDLGFDDCAAIALMESHSPSLTCGWDIPQVARSGGQQITAGTFFHHAKQHGWRPKR